LVVDLERVDGELAEIRDVAHRFRLIPAQSVFPSLERSVRDAAQTLGKRVAFEASGGEVRLDANVLASLRDALMHVVRNAVAHGVETEAERVALGKSPTGQVRLEVTAARRSGGFRVQRRRTGHRRGGGQKGRGGPRARARPLEVGSSCPQDQVIALLGAGGLTTSNDVTELSGRGNRPGCRAGDHVPAERRAEHSKRAGARCHRLRSGFRCAIASMQGLVVEAAGTLAQRSRSSAVRQTLRVTRFRHRAFTAAERLDSPRGPRHPLAVPLDRSAPALGLGRPAPWRVVGRGRPIRATAMRRGCAWTGCSASSNIVMRALPAVIEADPVVSGVSLDAEGNPQLVLDPGGLVAAAERGRGATSEEAHPRRAPVLVIDDSLTTRVLEQSILESAGYEVELAVSAGDALTKAHDRRYSLFIVDVEMPGMDGFEFVAQTRSDAALRDTPAILVTSRNGVEDRRRGEQVGARAYFVKGEFDQGQLLETIRTLIG
jgi:two-component system chemotaxis sensor kinase CheA